MHQRSFLFGASVLLVLAWFVGCAAGNNTNGSLAAGVGGNFPSGSSSSGEGGATTSSSSTTTVSSSSSTASSSSSGTVGTGGATASSSSSGTGGTGGSGPPPGLPMGATCTQDSDCQSQLCKPVVIGSNPVCVTPCTQQSDCGASMDYFCEPITAGSSNGYCIPHSPAHCLSCMQDSDCGSLSEVCWQAPGDNAKACNIDCSLGGADACPTDYSCTDQMVDGMPRKLCRPNIIPTCLDATGGWCDRLQLPQPCVRTNTAGMCIGQRACLSASKRFDKCDASAPQCKTDCSMQDPAGCSESYCPGATDTPTNCGMCGTMCPGYMKTADNVTCQNGSTCTFTCQGESYDVNNNPADGCEVPDAPQGNHVQSSAASGGNVSDCDSGGTDFTLTGHLISDKRVHENPAVVGFDTNSGSAPDWLSVFGVGHTFCQNDLVVTLTITGSSNPGCYQFHAITDKNSYTCTAGGGSCGFNNNGGGQFSDNTNIYFEVVKTCSTSTTENVSYSIAGHL